MLRNTSLKKSSSHTHSNTGCFFCEPEWTQKRKTTSLSSTSPKKVFFMLFVSSHGVIEKQWFCDILSAVVFFLPKNLRSGRQLVVPALVEPPQQLEQMPLVDNPIQSLENVPDAQWPGSGRHYWIHAQLLRTLVTTRYRWGLSEKHNDWSPAVRFVADLLCGGWFYQQAASIR